MTILGTILAACPDMYTSIHHLRDFLSHNLSLRLPHPLFCHLFPGGYRRSRRQSQCSRNNDIEFGILGLVVQVRRHAGRIKKICTSEEDRLEIESFKCGFDRVIPSVCFFSDRDELSPVFWREDICGYTKERSDK